MVRMLSRLLTLAVLAAAGMYAQTCTFALSPPSANVAATGGSGTITVTASQSSCTRMATASADWITISFGQTGTGNGSIGYSVAANTSSTARSGTITVGGASFAITQAGAQNTCTLTLSPSSASYPASGGSGMIAITASANSCDRAVTSSVSWITISLGATGTGNGTVAYSVAANTTALARTGVLSIGNATFNVSQSGLPCNLTLTPSSVSVATAGGSGSITVTATPGCAWTANSPVSWLTLSPLSGSGNGSVTYTAIANSSPQSRSTQATIGEQVLNVTQAGASCGYTLSPSSARISASAGSGTFDVVSSCSWTASSSASWLSISAGGSGTGNGTVTYAAQANTAAQDRTGTITIGTQQFILTQSGAGCSFTISPSSADLPATAGSGSISVSTTAGCGWTATTGATWITLAVSASSVTYTIAPNTTGAARTATITVAGQAFMLTQEAASSITLSAVTNAASYAEGAISPGEIVTLFGSGMGPATLTSLQLSPDGQYVTNSLAGTQVLFDGNPAPMIYASASQVSAIVPYALTGAMTTQVTVSYQGAASRAMAVAVAPSAPGIFSLDSSGAGPGAILNQDFSVNSASNPAARGSAVMIYATGEGQTTPAGGDGKLSDPSALATPLLPVSVQIGGVAAQVLYAGAAPGLVAGVLQVNVLIPAGAPAGAVPVAITVGANQSQMNVTVAVR